MRDSLSRVTSGGLRDDVQRSFFILTGLMDMGVVVPSWLGAYHKAMGGGVPGVDPSREADAIAYADGVVRQSQSSGSIKDLAAIQTGNVEWSNSVFAQTLGQSRGQRAIEFAFLEKGFDGGSGGHHSPLFR